MRKLAQLRVCQWWEKQGAEAIALRSILAARNPEEWAVISELLPKQWRSLKRKNDRQILNGIFYILRTGAPWRHLPERYGP